MICLYTKILIFRERREENLKKYRRRVLGVTFKMNTFGFCQGEPEILVTMAKLYFSPRFLKQLKFFPSNLVPVTIQRQF